MSNKHPHDAVIRAWLDGKTIQVYYSDEWLDSQPIHGTNCIPLFHPQLQYRIKPTVLKYRKYIYNNGGRPSITLISPFFSPENIEADPRFIRWIDTEWQEVEV